MRLLSFDYNGEPTVGIRHGDKVINLAVAAPRLPRDILGILQQGPEMLAAVAAAAEKAGDNAKLSLDTIKHLLPITHPDKNIGLGRNYLKHVKEMGGELPVFPGMFFRVPDSMIAHNQPFCHS